MPSTIITKNSSTASSVPSAGSLTQGELAVNVADKRLYTKDSGGTVVELGTNPASLTMPNGTANTVPYLNGSKVVTSGTALSFDGTNLGLGVTPSAWNSGYKAIQNLTSAFFGTTSRDMNLGANVFVNSGGNYAYIQSSFATNYSQFNGVHSWSVAPTGTAGNAITFTQAMTLDASGNLGIGTTSPNSSSFAKAITLNGSTSAGYEVNIAGTNIGYLGGDSGQLYLRTSGANPLTFATNGTERARIDSSGNLLVGTTSGPGTPGITCNVSAAGWYAADIINTNTNTPYGLRLRLPSSGSPQYLVIGQSDTTNVFYIASNGNVQNTNNSYGAISDAKLKDNIVDATPKLANLMQVKVRNYNLKGEYEQHKQLGVVAQELETIFPAMVDESPDYEEVTTTDEDGNEQTKRVLTGTTTKSVKYSVFIPMLIKAMQEQQAIIESLTTRITALEGQ